MALPPLANLLALLNDNTTGDISAADMRDIVTELYNGILLAGGGGGAGVPVGGMILVATDAVYNGFQDCGGQALSRTTYAALFAELGVRYGAGDGSTTFNVPKYNGFFLRVRDNGAGIDPNAATRTARPDGVTGDAMGTVQQDEFESHTHGTAAQKLVADTGGAGSIPAGGSLVRVAVPNTGGAETRPKNIYVRVLIRALPATPTHFATPPIAMTTGSKNLVQVAHGLGVVPSQISAHITSTASDLGYGVGFSVDVTRLVWDGVQNNGFDVFANNTIINAVQINDIKIISRNVGFPIATIDYSKWTLSLTCSA